MDIGGNEGHRSPDINRENEEKSETKELPEYLRQKLRARGILKDGTAKGDPATVDNASSFLLLIFSNSHLSRLTHWGPWFEVAYSNQLSYWELLNRLHSYYITYFTPSYLCSTFVIWTNWLYLFVCFCKKSFSITWNFEFQKLEAQSTQNMEPVKLPIGWVSFSCYVSSYFYFGSFSSRASLVQFFS